VDTRSSTGRGNEQYNGEKPMTHSLEIAEQMVRQLIAAANRSHADADWRYELTSDVDNIEVVPEPGTRSHTLRIHPCWLRYVVSQGDFKSCVADEIEAWHLLVRLTGATTAA
jgi:hypothetical protein